MKRILNIVKKMLKRRGKIEYNAIAKRSLHIKKTQFTKCQSCKFEYSLCSEKKVAAMKGHKAIKCPACGRKDKANEM